MNKLFQTMTCDAESKEIDSYSNDSNGPLEHIQDETSLDSICVNQLELQMHIGVGDDERSKKQRIIVDAQVFVNTNPNWRDDDIDDILSYEDIISGIEEIAAKRQFKLLETFGEYICDFCLNHASANMVTIEISKPDFFKQTESVSINMVRSK